MNRSRLKYWLVAAAAVLGGLAALLYCHLTPPIWEARATILAEGPAAQALPGVVKSSQFTSHIRELTDFWGHLTAAAIPGTHLVVLTAQDNAPAHTAAGCSAALNRLDAVMAWVGECTVEPLLLSDPIALPDAGNVETCLAGILTGGILAILLLFPLPKREEPLDFTDILSRWLHLAKRRLSVLLLLSLMLGAGNYFCEKSRYTPIFTATTLVSIGEYTPETAKNLSATVYGLLDSDLMTVPGITAAAVGQSNLFTLFATGETPEAAEAALTSAIALWPELAVYAAQDLTLLQRQPVQVTTPQPFPTAAVWANGCLLGALLWAALLFLRLLLTPEILTPPPPKRIISPKVKEGSP